MVLNTAASISFSQINSAVYFTNGNVGVNTTTPSTNLDVNGTINATGLSTFTNATATNVSTGGLNATGLSALANATATNVSTGGLNATGLSALANATATNVSTGTLIATTSVTSGLLSATNVVGNSISAGTLSATTITGANLSLSGNLSVAGTLTTVNITSTNILNTNISAGTINATGLSSLANVTATNVSTGVVIASTGLTTGTINVTGDASVNGGAYFNGISRLAPDTQIKFYTQFLNGGYSDTAPRNAVQIIARDDGIRNHYLKFQIGGGGVGSNYDDYANGFGIEKMRIDDNGVKISGDLLVTGGVLVASTGVTTGTINATGTSTLQNVTATNISTGGLNATGLSALANATATNVSAGVVIISTGLTTGTINATGTSTLQNVTATNMSSSTLIATTSVTSGLLSATNVVGNSISAGTLIGTTITGANLSLSGNLSVAGTYLMMPSSQTNLGLIAGDSADYFTHNGSTVNHYGLKWTQDTDELHVNGYLSAYGGIKFFTLGTKRMHIQQDGNVVIGLSTLTNAIATNISTGTLIATTSVTSGLLSATNVVGNSISAGTLSATTITGANLSLSGNLSVAGTLTTVNITSTNVLQTNVSAGTIASTNIIGTNISAGTLSATTITGANLSLSGNATVGGTINVTGNATVGGNKFKLGGATFDATVLGGENWVRMTTDPTDNANFDYGLAAQKFYSNSTLFVTSTSTLQNVTATNVSTGGLTVSGNTSLSTITSNLNLSLSSYGGVDLTLASAGGQGGMYLANAGGQFSADALAGDMIIRSTNTNGSLRFLVGSISGSAIVIKSSNDVTMTNLSTGNLNVSGALSKGSGTFNIQHPLKNNPDERLVHSFIEGPRCDLIYRGTVQLVNGIATVNIDSDCVQESESAMTQGTFEALCANPVYYLQNHDSFDRVKASISGNILTITCENTSSTNLIHWMVIAERKDPFIKEWDRTNSNGYLVTEYKN